MSPGDLRRRGFLREAFEMTRTVRIKGKRIEYDFWDETDLEGAPNRKFWYRNKNGGSEVVAETQDSYQSPAAVGFIAGLLATLSFGFWAYLARPHKPIRPRDSKGYVSFEHFVDARPWIAITLLVLATLVLAATVAVLPETIRAAHAGISRWHRALIVAVPVVVANITLAAVALSV
jgi:hypothetical protein